MSSAHDRFEALAGAIALGEATTRERERFDAHARSCEACRDDATTGIVVRALVETARDEESWRPSFHDAIFARIHERRSLRSRFAIGALGWAFAGSVVLNAAIVSGVASHVGQALRERVPPSEVVATRIEIERHPAIAVATPVPAFVARPARVVRAKPLLKRVTSIEHRVARAQRPRTSAARVEPAFAPGTAAAPALEAGVDDVLAGLDLASDRGLAAATSLHCRPNGDEFARSEACRTSEEDVRR